MSLVTTCPSCGTVFRMVREQLDASGGWVRCGHCMSVFDANAQLIQTADPDSQQHLTGQGLGSGDANPRATLSFAKQARDKAFWTSPAVRAALVCVCGFLILVLGLQILRAERDRIEQRLPALSSLVTRICNIATCPPRERRQIESWLIDNSSFQKDTTQNDTTRAGVQAFRLDVQLKNTASAAVLRPAIELSLLNSSDNLLVRSVLGTETDIVAAGEERRLSYRITANAADIVGYRLVLFYP
jgi:predicted Zn finger-like uncharacterized protein